MSQQSSQEFRVALICGGLYHDFDFARLELLQKLSKIPRIRTSVLSDYSNTAVIENAHALISYTTDVIPSDLETQVLDKFLSAGGRWFALHGTNSIIDIDEKGYAHCPRSAPDFMNLLGSQFLAHPPKGPFRVQNTQPDHPLVKGIESFDVDDELYLVDVVGDIEVLLHTYFSGQAMKGFAEREFVSNKPRPILYLRPWHQGSVLYLNLGHCRSHWDMQPLMEWYPDTERCSWDSPVFHKLLDRGIHWLMNRGESHA